MAVRLPSAAICVHLRIAFPIGGTIHKLSPSDPETRSADLIAGNIAALKTLFPDAFSEGKIEFTVLKQLLGGAVGEREEKYGLNWHGKRQARQLALTPSTGTLRPCPEDSVEWGTTQNLMIEGDNLEVLKLLQKSYAGKVKLIYIDPPYNTGNDFVYKDDYKDGVQGSPGDRADAIMNRTSPDHEPVDTQRRASTGKRRPSSTVEQAVRRVLAARTSPNDFMHLISDSRPTAPPAVYRDARAPTTVCRTVLMGSLLVTSARSVATTRRVGTDAVLLQSSGLSPWPCRRRRLGDIRGNQHRH